MKAENTVLRAPIKARFEVVLDNLEEIEDSKDGSD